MDPVSHCLLGRAFSCLDAKGRLGRGAGVAFVLGSIAPDADTVLDLSFGVLYGRGLVPTLQLIQIGTYWQTREIGK